jgi:isopentenyl diphosphate isomerase/L-lactate dehydrogenase-like FMN-dependent dehydrogenase
VTVDNPIHGIRPREARYGFSNVTNHDAAFSWHSYAELRKLTKLPVIPKGIQTVEDAKIAVEAGAPGIYISNHGGRQLDSSALPLETVLEIYTHAPEIFKKTEVFADGGVRYGTDVLKLLAMGVKMVGMGRPFMFANVFGEEGVTALIEIMRRELWIDAANLGVKNVRVIDTTYVSYFLTRCVRTRANLRVQLNLRRLEQFVYQM